MPSFENKVAFVTGGSRGIGAEVCKRLAEAGADVALTFVRSEDAARNVAGAVEKSGRKALMLQVDSADPAAIQSAIDRVAQELGRLDILVNNAGVFRAAPLETLTLKDFEETIAINVRAVFAACQRAALHMNSGSRIVSIGSNLADRVPREGLSLYALSKAAIVGFSKGLARELGSRGITVNVVQPGPTDTDMNPADGPNAQHQRLQTAMRRYGKAAEVADLVAWLIGEQAQSVTGAVFTIDGGANA